MLTRHGVVAVLSAALLYIAGLLLGYPFLFVLASGLLVAFAAGSVFLRRSVALTVDRTLAPGSRVAAGDDVEVTLTITNRAGKPAPGTPLLEPLGSGVRRLDLPRLTAGATTTLHYTLEHVARGRYQLGPLTSDRIDPFGFVVVLRSYGEPTTLWVRPRIHPIEPLASGRLRDLDGPAVDKALEGTVTFSGLREYVRGDDRRHIHWRSSARTGTLMVKQHVDVSEPRTAVVLETSADRYDADRFEVALEVAASIVAASARHHFPVSLYETLGSRVAGGRDEAPVAALDVLAGASVTPFGGVSRLASRLEAEESGTSLVVVTGGLDPADLALLGSVRRRFDTVVAVTVAAPGSALPVVPAGVRSIGVATGDEFASAWQAMR